MCQFMRFIFSGPIVWILAVMRALSVTNLRFNHPAEGKGGDFRTDVTRCMANLIGRRRSVRIGDHEKLMIGSGLAARAHGLTPTVSDVLQNQLVGRLNTRNWD